METVGWSPEMSLGIPKMDAAHKSFLQNLHQMEAMSDDQFGDAFLTLISKIEIGFHEEEQTMEEIDYPGIQNHLEQHARVLSALHHIAPRVMEGEIALGRDAVALLPQWFAIHLSTMDAALAFAVELSGEQGRAQRLS